ncbi:hypothetical protein X798_06200 [Onchocerca flexuosa]|uniref:Uncharacterized protein n=1 Tax=Onchocerca flexuosa TaxID=387005 RepID=A0A238BNG1_9BILA|nr:hypothetical protein X798_06200 [Onchocerca flexuosa]
MFDSKSQYGFQKPNPFPKSIYDNVAYGPKLHGMVKNKGKLDEILENSLTKVGLWEELKDRLRDSALMKQRERRFAHHTDGLTMISWFDAIGLVNRFHGSGGTGQMGGYSYRDE